MPKLLIKLPSRTRPKKFFDAVDNIQSMIGIEEFVIASALDLDDSSMNDWGVRNKIKEYDNLIIYWGLSKNKISAINRSIPMNIDWTHMIVSSDDFVFLKRGFGQQILHDFEQYFPDGDGLLHYPDGHVNEKLITLPIMGRAYYERTNYIYNPDYISVYGDCEQQEVAKKLGKYQYVPIQIADHQHFRWGFGGKDDLMAKTDSPENYQKDRATYNRRKLLNFGL